MGNSTSTQEDPSQGISTHSETFYSPQLNRHSFPGPRPTHPADVSTTQTRNSMPPDRRPSLTSTGGPVLPNPSPTFTVPNPRGSSGSTSSAASAAREFRKRFNGSIADQRSDLVSASPFVGSPLTSVDDFGQSPTTPTQSSSSRPPSSMLAQPPASAPDPSPRLSDHLNHLDFDNTVRGNASTADRPSSTGRPRADSIGAPYYDNTRGNSKQQVTTERADPLVISVATPLDDAPADPAVMAEEERAYRRKSVVVHGNLFPGQDPAGTIGIAPLTATGAPTARKGIPTIINWTQGGNNVYITGTFNGWKHKIRLVKSTQDFTTILDLPPGTHRLKFIVDDEWKCSADLDTATDPDGNLVNYVEVGEEDDDADDFVSPRRRSPDDPFPEPALSSTPPGSYNATIPAYLLALATQQSENSATNSSPSQPPTPQSQAQAGAQQPPSLPPHLEKVLLNSQAVSEEDNSVLPVPNHVTLNHLYACSIRDGVMAVAGTARYRKKYITTMYYKPVFTN